MSGRLTSSVEIEGTGRSAVALLGSLSGGGKFKMLDGNVLHFDPAAFEAAFPNCPIGHADENGDGRIDGRDIAQLVSCIVNGGCP